MFLKLWNYIFKIWYQLYDSVCKECVSISLLKKIKKKKKKFLQAKHKLEIEQKKKKEINIYFFYRLSQKKKQEKKKKKRWLAKVYREGNHKKMSWQNR